MAISPGLPQISTAPRPDWLSRNWKWVVPVGFLSLVVLIVGFVGCLFLIIETSFQHSDCYKHAMARARSSPQVTEKIGEPLVPGWLGSGNINVSGSSGNAEMSIPITGPRGKGSIYLLQRRVRENGVSND